MYQPGDSAQPGRMAGRTRWVLAGFLAIALFFLLTEHRAHLFGFLPYLLLLACPLMHLFHGHGQHGHGASGPARRHPTQAQGVGDDDDAR